MINFNQNVYQPQPTEIVERIQESPSIFTLHLRFCDPATHANFKFMPGQFNMLYLYGAGEVAISIMSDPENDRYYAHTIRALGRVTHAMARLTKGDQLGVRGPFGRGWPLQKALGKDVMFITGGLGCAPVVSAINYIVARRQDYGHLYILQGVKHSDDLIYRDKYQQWAKLADTTVLLAADVATSHWSGMTGNCVQLLMNLSPRSETLIMMCGPEIMMRLSAKALTAKNIREENIYLSMERNMQCALGHCGHCQFGGKFICKDGPVFNYPAIKDLLSVEGF